MANFHSSSGPSHLPLPASVGSLHYDVLSGKTYVSTGAGWVPRYSSRMWAEESDGNMNIQATETKITKVLANRYVPWSECTLMRTESEFAASLYFKMVRNKLTLTINVLSYGFNPNNGLLRKVDEIKGKCSEYATGFWSCDIDDRNIPDDVNRFDVKIDLYFENIEDQQVFLKNYVVLDKLSS